MSRRCSHCGYNGHNSRTCLDKGFKLFGVRLTDPSSSSSPCSAALMRKSVSMGNLSNYGFSEAASSSSASPLNQPDLGDSLDGYASDDLVHTNSSARERKKGVPWTEEEHRLFLLGLQKLGKGDWRGISRNFVKTRTPTQVASHAQKYFLRRSNVNKRRRRSSLFDISPDTVSSLFEEAVSEESFFEQADAGPGIHELTLGQNMFGGGGTGEAPVLSRHAYHVGDFPLSLKSRSLSCMPMNGSGIMEEVSEAGENKDLEVCEMDEVAEDALLQFPAGIRRMQSVPEGNDDSGGELNQLGLPYPLLAMWPGPGLWSFESNVVRPTPIIPMPPPRTDDTVKLSELSLTTTRPVMEPTPLSFKLLKEGSRHSAFHSMTSGSNSELDTQTNLGNVISVS